MKVLYVGGETGHHHCCDGPCSGIRRRNLYWKRRGCQSSGPQSNVLNLLHTNIDDSMQHNSIFLEGTNSSGVCAETFRIRVLFLSGVAAVLSQCWNCSCGDFGGESSVIVSTAQKYLSYAVKYVTPLFSIASSVINCLEVI